MKIITIIIFGIIIFVVYLYFKSKHKHEWKYSRNTEDNKYQWYYCTGCLLRQKCRLGEDGLIHSQVYKLKQLRKAKK